MATLFLLLLLWSQRGILSSFSRYGYLGLFVINVVSNATIFLPIPSIASVFVGGSIWNPFLVAVVSAIGAALGELVGYFLGYGGRGLWDGEKEESSWFGKIAYLFRHNGFITIFFFSLIPFPLFDFVGIISGSMNYPLWKFALAVTLGRFVRDIFIAWGGARIL